MNKKMKIQIEDVEARNKVNIKGIQSSKELDASIDLAIRKINGQDVEIVGVEILSDYGKSIDALENVLRDLLSPSTMSAASEIINDLKKQEPQEKIKDSNVILNLLSKLFQLVIASSGAPQLVTQALEWIKHIGSLVFKS
jgi:hypothetical protein